MQMIIIFKNTWAQQIIKTNLNIIFSLYDKLDYLFYN